MRRMAFGRERVVRLPDHSRGCMLLRMHPVEVAFAAAAITPGSQIGSLLLLMNRSVSARTGGRFSIVPMTGIWRHTPRAIGKKSPKRLRKPQHSMHMPATGQPYSTIPIPPKKHAVPFAFRFWKKKRYVFAKPIMSTTPVRKSTCSRTRLWMHECKRITSMLQKAHTFPIASRPLSKNSSTPSSWNNRPPVDKPMPIFR